MSNVSHVNTDTNINGASLQPGQQAEFDNKDVEQLKNAQNPDTHVSTPENSATSRKGRKGKPKNLRVKLGKFSIKGLSRFKKLKPPSKKPIRSSSHSATSESNSANATGKTGYTKNTGAAFSKFSIKSSSSSEKLEAPEQTTSNSLKHSASKPQTNATSKNGEIENKNGANSTKSTSSIFAGRTFEMSNSVDFKNTVAGSAIKNNHKPHIAQQQLAG